MFNQRLTPAEQRRVAKFEEGTAAEPRRNSHCQAGEHRQKNRTPEAHGSRQPRPGVSNMGANTAYIDRVPDARTAWVSKALCRSTDPDELFGSGKAQTKAVVICRHCPVVAECLAEALDNQIEFGVWGGMTERQRRALLKQHPEVVSWSEFFAAQRKHRNTDQPA